MFFYPCSPQCPAPVDRLPVELLSYIFVLGTHALEDSGSDAERSLPFTSETIRTPLTLSSVSRHWRSIARNTPSLWTSLCITAEMIETLEDDDMDLAHPPTVFNAHHLITYLTLSRNYPLDILIDARDQDWDFSEPEIPSEYECDTYTPPFSSDHMSTVISLLLPHLHRWRSLDILTDSWAPMYFALQRIQNPLITLGAPLLESLTLMRCNDFVSYSPIFEPREMKGPTFLTLPDYNACDLGLLPRLKNLTLRGVHVNWSSLASILSHSNSGLQTIELSSHSADVRPTHGEFHRLLVASPLLNKLVVNGSGPCSPEGMDEAEGLFGDELAAVPLPCLQELTLGFRSAYDGHMVLDLLDAPNVKTLILEDSNHPGDSEDVDAGTLLTYLGTGECHSPQEDLIVPTSLDGLRYHLSPDKEPLTPTSRRRDGFIEGELESQAVFRRLESVTLKRVKACSRPFQNFLAALPNLRRLELGGMPMQSLRALLPRDRASGMTQQIPCPHLQSVCIRGLDHLPLCEMELIDDLSSERLAVGAFELREVDLHVADASEDISISHNGMQVRVFKEAFGVLEDDEDTMGCNDDLEDDPFRAGGVFNDPFFDAYYAGLALAR